MGEMNPELFRTIFKTVKEFIHILDTSGRILKTNPHTIKTLGYKKEEIVGKPLVDFFSPGSKKIFTKSFPEVMEKGEGRHEVELVCKNGRIITVDCQTTVIRDTEENISSIVVVERDITEKKKTEAILMKSEEKYRILFERSNDGIFLVNNKTGRYIDANEAAERITGRSISELKTLTTKDISPHFADERLHKLRTISESFNFGEVNYIHKDGTTITAILDAIRLNEELIFGVAHDITARKKAERRHEFATEILEVLNSHSTDMDLVKAILLKIQDYSGMEAVGIRLREGEDFPYYRTSGFSEEFVEAERYLCKRDSRGGLINDLSGSPVLECMCGNILRRRTDPSKPYFTEGGSFWSNNTSQLLVTTTEEDRMARTRNRCNSDGYESVALIPLLSGSEIIGLLQLNDHKIGRFTIKDIEFYEEIGASIGVALKRVKAEEEHHLVSEIMSNMNEGVYLINVEDIEIVWANPKFERMFGYDPGEMLGKHVSIVNAPTERDPRETAKEITKILKETGEWHGEVKNIKKDGTPFWCYANTSVFNHPFYGEVMVSVHTDITESKIVQEALLKSERKHRTLFESMSLGVVYQNADGNITSANPAAERILGLTLDQMQGLTSIDPRWRAIHEDGSDFPGENHPSMVALKTGTNVENVIMGVFNPSNEEYTWININAVPQTKPGEEKPFQVYTVFEDITVRTRMEAEREKLLHDLGERVKELRGLYGLSKLAGTPYDKLEELFQSMVELLPPSWQYSDHCCGRIIFEGNKFESSHFKETKWKQEASIHINGRKMGVVQVFYKKEFPIVFEGPFQKEERHLINEIAERMGEIIQQKRPKNHY